MASTALQVKLGELNEIDIQFEKAWEAALIPSPVPTPPHSDANADEKEEMSGVETDGAASSGLGPEARIPPDADLEAANVKRLRSADGTPKLLPDNDDFLSNMDHDQLFSFPSH